MSRGVVLALGFWAVVSLGLLGLILGLLPRELRKSQALLAHPSATLSEARPGPGRYVGTLRGAPDRITPTGVPSALWVGWVTQTVKSGKSTQTNILCWFGEVDGTTLESSGVVLPLRMLTQAGDAEVGEQGWVTSSWKGEAWWPQPRARVLLGELSYHKELPAWVRRHCADKLSDVGTLEYVEGSIAPGTTLEVSGCRDAESLRGCGDGLDWLSVDGALAVIAVELSIWQMGLCLMVALCGFWILMIGFTLVEKEKR